jgi:riboflavin kinase/FMN adenylyltransferase
MDAMPRHGKQRLSGSLPLWYRFPMQVFRGHLALPGPLRAPVVTIGNFDGVHLGHQRLFSVILERARARGGQAVVFTFRPHPVKLLAPELAPPLITPYEEKLRLIEQTGIDVAIEEEFNRELAAFSPRRFVDEVLVRAIGVRDIVVGYDFTFGRDRAGNVQVLTELGGELGFEVHVEPAFSVSGIIASSTKVREFVLEGRVGGAALLLGRSFSVTGTVVRGDGRGRKLGFPTANLQVENELIPKAGVYAGRAYVRGEAHRAVVNIGFAPTFQSRGLTVEAHLLDTSGDLYGEKMTLEFTHHLREERRFPSVEELMAQIGRDVESARGLP